MPEKQETLYMFLWLSQRPFSPKIKWLDSTAEFQVVFSGEAPERLHVFLKLPTIHVQEKVLRIECQKLLVQTSYFSPNRFVVEARVAVTYGHRQHTNVLMLDRPVILGFTSLLLNLKDIMHVNPLKLFWQSKHSILEEAIYHRDLSACALGQTAWVWVPVPPHLPVWLWAST